MISIFNILNHLAQFDSWNWTWFKIFCTLAPNKLKLKNLHFFQHHLNKLGLNSSSIHGLQFLAPFISGTRLTRTNFSQINHCDWRVRWHRIGLTHLGERARGMEGVGRPGRIRVWVCAAGAKRRTIRRMARALLNKWWGIDKSIRGHKESARDMQLMETASARPPRAPREQVYMHAFVVWTRGGVWIQNPAAARTFIIDSDNKRRRRRRHSGCCAIKPPACRWAMIWSYGAILSSPRGLAAWSRSATCAERATLLLFLSRHGNNKSARWWIDAAFMPADGGPTCANRLFVLQLGERAVCFACSQR